MDLQEVGGGCGDWMELAEDRDSWRALVSTVMNLRAPKMRGISWLAAEPVSFSRRTLLHGVSKCVYIYIYIYIYIYMYSKFLAVFMFANVDLWKQYSIQYIWRKDPSLWSGVYVALLSPIMRNCKSRLSEVLWCSLQFLVKSVSLVQKLKAVYKCRLRSSLISLSFPDIARTCICFYLESAFFFFFENVVNFC